MSPSGVLKVVAVVLKFLILIISVLVFLFALFSGAEDYGGGINGLLKNSPNALPWLILFALVFIAWKWELAGGILLSMFGIFSFFMFDVIEGNFAVLLIVTLPLLSAGIFLIFYHLKKKTSTGMYVKIKHRFDDERTGGGPDEI